MKPTKSNNTPRNQELYWCYECKYHFYDVFANCMCLYTDPPTQHDSYYEIACGKFEMKD